jgi:hypothetical protein
MFSGDNTAREGCLMRITVKIMAFAAALAALVPAAPAAAGSPAQIYYVPLPEDQIHAALRTIFPGDGACGASQGREVGDPIVTYLSITPVVAGTRITYDHWEDGYEPDISHPVQPSTEVWGDGDAANGVPPGFAADLIGLGSVVVLHNPVRIGDRGAVLDFDGGDKLAASAPISVTRAAWATGTSTMLAGAVEVRDLRDWGRSYRAPEPSGTVKGRASPAATATAASRAARVSRTTETGPAPGLKTYTVARCSCVAPTGV